MSFTKREPRPSTVTAKGAGSREARFANSRARPGFPLGSLTLTFATARELPSIWRHTKEFGGLSSAAGGPFRGAPLWGWAIFHNAVTTAIEVDMLYALIAAAHRTGTNGDELQHAS